MLELGKGFAFVARQYIPAPESREQVEALINDLGLEFFGRVEKVEEGEDMPP